MNHAGAGPNLIDTYCRAELGEHDRKLAAFEPATMAMLDCPTCRRGLGLAVAWMRVPGADEVPLQFYALDPELSTVVCVNVPALGHLMIRRPLGSNDTWAAIHVPYPIDDEPPIPTLRDVEGLDDGRLRVQLLRKVDRLDVIVEPPAAWR